MAAIDPLGTDCQMLGSGGASGYCDASYGGAPPSSAPSCSGWCPGGPNGVAFSDPNPDELEVGYQQYAARMDAVFWHGFTNSLLRQAEEDALTALDDDGCSLAIDGGSGAATATLGYNLAAANQTDGPNGVAPGLGDLAAKSVASIEAAAMPNFIFGDNGHPIFPFQWNIAMTVGTPQHQVINGVSHFTGIGAPSVITVNSSSGSGFIQGMGPFHGGSAANRALTILHELGHAVANAGIRNSIVDDMGNGKLSGRNNDLIAEDCF